jgi:hypothetical protein
MPDEPTPITQNWRLLVVAFALGLVVMVIYNLHIAQVRSAGKGPTAKVLKVVVDIDENKEVAEEMLTEVEVPESLVTLLGDIVKADRTSKSWALGRKALQRIPAGTLLRSIQIDASRLELSPVGPGMVGQVLPVDPRKTPGELLKIHARVNVMATIPGGRPGQTLPTRVLRSAHVIGIGERAAEELTSAYDSAGKGRASYGRYTKITLELPEDLSEQLSRVLTQSSETPWIELTPRPKDGGDWPAPELTQAAKALLPPRTVP